MYKKKARVSFFLFNFMNLFHKFIVSFLECHFVLLCSPISFSSLYYGEMKICMLSVNKTCLCHGDFKKVSFFQLHECQLVGYVDNFLC
jgi:hypothetical protein